jgi:ankyrin repeat protein
MLIRALFCLAVVALLLTYKQLMKQLLADPAFPPNKPVQMPNGTIYIPLHVAIMAHNTAAEKLLLEAGAASARVYAFTAHRRSCKAGADAGNMEVSSSRCTEHEG